MTRIRMNPDDRKAQMTEAALKIVQRKGVKALTRVALAQAIGATDGLVNRYFGTRDLLRSEIIAEAAARKDTKVLAFAIAEGFDIPAVPRQLRRDANAAAAKRMARESHKDTGKLTRKLPAFPH